jgi:hypothetical protein
MQREIRMAGHDPTGLSGASILIADDAEFQFQTVISEINRKNFPYRAIGGALALYDL